MNTLPLLTTLHFNGTVRIASIVQYRRLHTLIISTELTTYELTTLTRIVTSANAPNQNIKKLHIATLSDTGAEYMAQLGALNIAFPAVEDFAYKTPIINALVRQ